VVKFEAVLPQ